MPTTALVFDFGVHNLARRYLLASDVLAQLWATPLDWLHARWTASFLTSLQKEELTNLENSAALQICRNFPTLDVSGSAAAVAIQMARLAQDVSNCPADGLFGLLSRAACGRTALKSARNQDLIVGQIAIRRDFCVLTDDCHLARAIRQCSGSTMALAEFCMT